MPPSTELVTTERVGLVVWLLSQGYALTTQQLGVRLGMEADGVRGMMQRLSRVVPIYEEPGGGWAVVREPNAAQMAAQRELQRTQEQVKQARALLSKLEARLRERKDLMQKGLRVRRVQRRLEELARQLSVE